MIDERIEKGIYKKLSTIMTQDMDCECEVTKIEFKSAMKIQCFADGTQSAETSCYLPKLTFICDGNEVFFIDGYANKMYEEYKQICERYKNGSVVKVLFVAEKNRKTFEAWYNYMDVVKKHRKIVIACNSPLDFCHKFDASKMGAWCTMFYFDKELGAAEVHACVEEFRHHYNDEDFKYIVKSKLCAISIDDMIATNDMSRFEELKVDLMDFVDSDNKKSMTISEEESDQIFKEMLHLTRRLDDHAYTDRALESQTAHLEDECKKTRQRYFKFNLQD